MKRLLLLGVGICLSFSLCAMDRTYKNACRAKIKTFLHIEPDDEIDLPTPESALTTIRQIEMMRTGDGDLKYTNSSGYEEVTVLKAVHAAFSDLYAIWFRGLPDRTFPLDKKVMLNFCRLFGPDSDKAGRFTNRVRSKLQNLSDSLTSSDYEDIAFVFSLANLNAADLAGFTGLTQKASGELLCHMRLDPWGDAPHSQYGECLSALRTILAATDADLTRLPDETALAYAGFLHPLKLTTCLPHSVLAQVFKKAPAIEKAYKKIFIDTPVNSDFKNAKDSCVADFSRSRRTGGGSVPSFGSKLQRDLKVDRWQEALVLRARSVFIKKLCQYIALSPDDRKIFDKTVASQGVDVSLLHKRAGECAHARFNDDGFVNWLPWLDDGKEDSGVTAEKSGSWASMCDSFWEHWDALNPWTKRAVVTGTVFLAACVLWKCRGLFGKAVKWWKR